MDSDRTLSHRLFEIGVILKGAHGIFEFFVALFIYIASGTTLYRIVTSVLSGELVEDPNDFLANLILQHFHVTSQGKDFVALYFFVSAITNIVLATGLLLRKKIFFPLSITALSGFILYQTYLYARTSSPWLIALVLYDCVIAALIYMEYKRRWPAASQSSSS